MKTVLVLALLLVAANVEAKEASAKANPPKVVKAKPVKVEKEKPSQRILASARGNGTSQCSSLFERGRELMLSLVEKNKAQYPQELTADLKRTARATKVTCVPKAIEPYGFVSFKEERTVLIEQDFANISNLLDGPIGQLGMQKFDIASNGVMLDHVLAGIALHSYAEQIGLDDSQFDLMFQLIKDAQK